MSTALAAAYDALRTRLIAGAEPWNDRAYQGRAPAGTAYPYVVYFWSGGGEDNRTRKRDANLMITVKAVAKTIGQALSAADRIDALLNDHGLYDNAGDSLVNAKGWYILTITQEGAFELVETFAAADDTYHQGGRYRFIMEEI